MVKRNNVHDRLVMKLQTQLFQSHDYEEVWTFWEYCENGLAGEVDLLALADEIYDFYEIKSTYHQKAKRKAHEQYDRFQKAFPRFTTNGFMYCGEGLIRL